MEQFMIGVSKQDIRTNNLPEEEGVYYVSQQQIGNLYNRITGFNR